MFFCLCVHIVFSLAWSPTTITTLTYRPTLALTHHMYYLHMITQLFSETMVFVTLPVSLYSVRAATKSSRLGNPPVSSLEKSTNGSPSWGIYQSETTINEKTKQIKTIRKMASSKCWQRVCPDHIIRQIIARFQLTIVISKAPERGFPSLFPEESTPGKFWVIIFSRSL